LKKTDKHFLSKSTFIRGVQCHKSLWLNKHHPELRDTITRTQQAIFDRGHDIGKLAQQLFPGGIDASPASPSGYTKSVIYTRQLIERGATVIYEAAFRFKGVLCALDMIVNEDGSWKAYEVKSSTSISETYVLDAALQYYVIVNSGIDLEDISIVYINNQYVRQGMLDLHQLFSIESVKQRIMEKQDYIRTKAGELKMVLFSKYLPDIAIGPHCTTPYTCDFMGFCWKDVPEYSIFNIADLSGHRKFQLFGDGILEFSRIPDDFPLSARQWLQVKSELEQTEHINRDAIGEFLGSLTYPFYYMDFETTVGMAVPLYDQSRPYQQIPFQYSLHYKEDRNSELSHFEYLAEAGADPRVGFIESLLRDIGNEGNILVYNADFEVRILNQLAFDFPVYASSIEKVIERVKDLMILFRKKLYYSPVMRGSYSIKNVLPALVPGFSYDDLAIRDGTAAGLAYERLFTEKNKVKTAQIRRDLLNYCAMDTLAMVRIVERLEQVI
jgi:hypothetical protein